MRAVERVGLVVLLLGAAALGIIFGVVAFQTRPDWLLALLAQAEREQLLSGTATAEVNWDLTFIIEFDAGYLPPGDHTYRLGLSCPQGIGSNVWTGTLTISPNSFNASETAFMRPTGLWNAMHGGQQLTVVGADQPIGAAISLRYPTQAQAEQARTNCRASVELNFDPPVRMSPLDLQIHVP